jgi:hypothetical protein
LRSRVHVLASFSMRYKRGVFAPGSFLRREFV